VLNARQNGASLAPRVEFTRVNAHQDRAPRREIDRGRVSGTEVAVTPGRVPGKRRVRATPARRVRVEIPGYVPGVRPTRRLQDRCHPIARRRSTMASTDVSALPDYAPVPAG